MSDKIKPFFPRSNDSTQKGSYCINRPSEKILYNEEMDTTTSITSLQYRMENIFDLCHLNKEIGIIQENLLSGLFLSITKNGEIDLSSRLISHTV